MPEFTNVYFKMSTGNGDLRGPWNSEPTFERREATVAVDGGDGLATVTVDPQDEELLNAASLRLQSDPKSDPLTGAMLGMGAGAGGISSGEAAGRAAIGPRMAAEKAEAQAESRSQKPS